MTKFSSIAAASIAVLMAGVVFAADPAKDADHKHHEEGKKAKVTHAIVGLVPTEGNQVQGWLTMTATEGGVQIKGDVSGLTPGKHGFHIHEFGDLSDPAGKKAGGHYNPDGHEHGGPDSSKHHAGDLGNIEAGKDGIAHVEVTAKGLHLGHVLGRSIVVHAGPDDLKSQPSGDSGARVAVGIIGLAEASK